MKGDEPTLRAWIESDGLRVCRDVYHRKGSFLWPEHAVGIDSTGHIRWEQHEEGAWVPPLKGDELAGQY